MRMLLKRIDVVDELEASKKIFVYVDSTKSNLELITKTVKIYKEKITVQLSQKYLDWLKNNKILIKNWWDEFRW